VGVEPLISAVTRTGAATLAKVEFRFVAALDANAWRRQDTAQYPGTSGKVLWEKMRKFQIFDGEPETRKSE
jgi:transcriptional regulator with AAA-type ATPase domain